MYELIRRMQINELFKDPTKNAADILQYSEIALDLKDYGFAAMLYWNSLTHGQAGRREESPRADSTISCTAWNNWESKISRRNFNGDHAAAFAEIKAQRFRELMEKNPAFQAGEKTPEPEPAPAPGKEMTA